MLREFLREKMRLAWLQTSLSPWEFIDGGLEEGISSRHVAQWRVHPANMQLHLDSGLLQAVMTDTPVMRGIRRPSPWSSCLVLLSIDSRALQGACACGPP